MQKLDQLYEGKAKKVFKTDDPKLLIVDYKDDATAFNAGGTADIEFYPSRNILKIFRDFFYAIMSKCSCLYKQLAAV